MMSKVLCILMGALMGWSLAVGAVEEPSPCQNQQASSVPTCKIDPESAKTNWRIVALRSKASRVCPMVPGWEEEPLLDKQIIKPSPQDSDRALLRRLGLDRYCVYTSREGVPPASLPSHPDLVDVKGGIDPRDRMALAPASEAPVGRIGRMTWRTLAEQFLIQTGHAPISFDRDRKVRLVFFDTQPTDEGGPEEITEASGTSFHGFTMMYLARQLLCDRAGHCAADIASRLTLGYREFDPNRKTEPDLRGGNIGLVSDLADAIVEEVWSWRKSRSSQRLILNFSLGWDGELFEDLDDRRISELDPSVQAVYKALRYARDRGALVIAAAGNRRGGPEKSTLPLLPAAWELRRPRRISSAGVYAVGGIDWQGLPLPNSRDGGRPRRVAYGDHAVAATGTGHPTAIYTGTSVSAAVVSSIAAVVWDLRPELRPDQVMRLIDRSGESLEPRADFYSGMRAPQTRRLSLCRAAVRASRPRTMPPACGTSRVASLPDLSPLAARREVLSFAPASPPPLFIPPCDARTRLFTTSGDVLNEPCPTDQYGGRANQRWAAPQPPDDPCPGCTLIPPPSMRISMNAAPGLALAADRSADGSEDNSTLVLEINEEWVVPAHLSPGTGRYASIESATLDIDCYREGERVERKTYEIPPPLTPGSPPRFLELAGTGPLEGCTAALNFKLITADGKVLSVQNPVYLSKEAREDAAPTEILASSK
jgi:Subtilase family